MNPNDATVGSNFVKIENPYHPNDLESAKGLYHEKVIEQILQILQSKNEEKIILLMGDPGSGKTSTLKKIETSSQIPLKKFSPIYLDAQKYKNLSFEELLFAIQRDLTEKLVNLGKNISNPSYFKKPADPDTTAHLRTFLLNVDSVIDSNSTMLLILDEFDTLVANIDQDVISKIIESFQRIQKSWANYVLIFSVNKKFKNILISKPLKKLIVKAFEINVDNLLEKNIVTEILEPAKKKLSYSEEALEEIIWLSGKNLYIQQLICHHLVDYLNEKKSNNCSLEDVEQTVQRILNEERQEFNHAWNNILSMASRLIASALADKELTESNEKHLYVKEDTILHDIFGKTINTKIEELHNFGYLNQMEGTRFARSPFKIPLYGRWISTKHPFIKTVIEHIENVGDKIEFEKLIEYEKKKTKKDLIPFNKETILRMADKWFLLKKNIIHEGFVEKEQIKDFFDSLAGRLRLKLKEEPDADDNSFIMNIRSLGIGSIKETFCIMQDSPELTQEELLRIETIATVVAEEEAQTKLTLLFYFQNKDIVEELTKKPYLNLVAIDENALKRILLSKNCQDAFKRTLINYLSLQKISPYRTAGVARLTFYGRSDIINRISNAADNSYSIVGARRIGKTSLLHKLQENPPPNTAFIFMNLELEFKGAKTYRPFLKNLLEKIEEVLDTKIESGIFSMGREMAKLPKIIKQLAKSGRKIVIILDEVDYMIEFDQKHGNKLTSLFRSMAQNHSCQFIFAGFKSLYHRKREIENPLYNFCEEIVLKPLDRDASMDLITMPMERMGIKYANEGDKEVILEYTACHPNLLQYFCKNLVEKIEKHQIIEHRRIIFIDDIEASFNVEYEDYVFDDVYMFNSDLTPISRLILVLMVEEHPRKASFSTDEIRERLMQSKTQVSRNEVHQYLRTLVMRFILHDTGRENYSFALSIFPQILKKKIDKDFKDRTILEIKENG